jgi:hypothetical protein
MNINQKTTENSLTVKPLNQKLESGIERLQCSFPIEGRRLFTFKLLVRTKKYKK